MGMSVGNPLLDALAPWRNQSIKASGYPPPRVPGAPVQTITDDYNAAKAAGTMPAPSYYLPNQSSALQAINAATYPTVQGRDVGNGYPFGYAPQLGSYPSPPTPWSQTGIPAPLRVASANTSGASQAWPGAPQGGGLFGGIGDFLGGLGTKVADISGQVGGALSGAGKAVTDTVQNYGPLMAALKPYTGGTVEQRLTGQVGPASGNGGATASLASSGPDVSGFQSFGSVDAWKAAGKPSNAMVTTNNRGLQKSGGALIGDGY